MNSDRNTLVDDSWKAEAESGSMLGRVILALILLIGFYVLALSIAGACLSLVYWDLTESNRVHLKLIIFGLFVGFGILWALLPRFDKFEKPGPELEEAAHPQLFELIREVAKMTGEEVPEHVYLVNEVNAWVTHRGGVMGFGSKRVMGLGLPLMQALTVSELKAVIAHEFGHFHGGDVALGPWLYKTREAIGRTIQTMEKGGGEDSFISKPFSWYGTMFVKVTHKISRSQEYGADAVACKAIGSEHLISSLGKLGGLSLAWDVYLDNVVLPVLNHSRKPPVAKGFQQFLKGSGISKMMAEQSDFAFSATEAHPFDTHPPNGYRVAAAKRFAAEVTPPDHRMATCLLDDMGAMSDSLINFHLALHGFDDLKPIEWNSVGKFVYLPAWLKQIAEESEALQGITFDQYPQLAKNLDTLWRRIEFGEQEPSKEEKEDYAEWLLGIALGVALHQRGWSLLIVPGETRRAEKDGEAMAFTSLIECLKTDEISVETYREFLEKHQLMGLAVYSE